MKKLMIAAAAAAMICGAFAEGYDFTANVKTTTGKAGKQTTTYKVNLGQDENGTYWWDDAGYATAEEGKKDLAKWTNDEKAYYAEQIEFGNPEWAENPLNIGMNEFGIPEYYKGKAKWCANFSYKIVDEDCYRVAASRKFKGIVTMDGCCEDQSWEFQTAPSYVMDPGMVEFLGADPETDPTVEITEKLLFAFGGVQLSKAQKCEYVGEIGEFGNKFGWALAGQGAVDTKVGYIKNISGNIVGILENPECEYCCEENDVATVFDCDSIWVRVTPGVDAKYDGTAAFGTWSIKYNKKY